MIGERTVEVRGHRLRVVGGRGDGRRVPLLLLNGIGAGLELLEPFVRALPPGLGVIRLDVPGSGRSSTPWVPYRLGGMVRVVTALLDELGHQRVDVLGVSWGGGLAQQLAIQQPRRVRRLVLVATAAGALMIPPGPEVLARLLTARPHRDRHRAAEAAGRLYGGTLRSEARGHIADLLAAHTRTGSRRGYYYQLLAAATWTSLPFLPTIRHRTLVLAGDDDPIIPVLNARVAHALLPRGRLHVYRGGHLALVTETTTLAPLVEDFLRAP